MTNNFGFLLLNKIQNSHNETQNMIADFMTKTTEIQTNFWYCAYLMMPAGVLTRPRCSETMVRELKGVQGHSADPGSSPLRLHTHRRTPQNPAEAHSSPSRRPPGKRAAGKTEVIGKKKKKPEVSDAVLLALQVCDLPQYLLHLFAQLGDGAGCCSYALPDSAWAHILAGSGQALPSSHRR